VAILIVIFVVILLASFAVLALASRPSKEQKMLASRLDELHASLDMGAVQESPDLLRQLEEENSGWIAKIPLASTIPMRLKPLLEQSGSSNTVGQTIARCVGGAIAGLVIPFIFHLAAFTYVVLPLALGASPIWFLRFKKSRRLKAFADALPDSIDLMARALRAGHSVGSAIEVLAEQGLKPVSTEFGRVYQEQNFGLPFRDSLLNMAARVDSTDLQFLVTAMLVQKETGGNLTEILDRTTYVIRERLRIHGEVRVKTAQGRLTGWILAMLPVVLALLVNFINPGFEKPLFQDHLGRTMLYCGAGMLTVGTLVIRKIVDIKV
jgi:tight adherence protein B